MFSRTVAVNGRAAAKTDHCAYLTPALPTDRRRVRAGCGDRVAHRVTGYGDSLHILVQDSPHLAPAI